MSIRQLKSLNSNTSSSSPVTINQQQPFISCSNQSYIITDEDNITNHQDNDNLWGLFYYQKALATFKINKINRTIYLTPIYHCDRYEIINYVVY